MIEFLVYFLNQIDVATAFNAIAFDLRRIKSLKKSKKTLDK